MTRTYRTAIAGGDPLTHWATHMILSDLAATEGRVDPTRYVDRLDADEPAVVGHCLELQEAGLVALDESGLAITEAGEAHLEGFDPTDVDR
ncbi:MAG: hypothetical protein ABEJ70_08820 [Halobacteriaceae archaeon]